MYLKVFVILLVAQKTDNALVVLQTQANNVNLHLFQDSHRGGRNVFGEVQIAGLQGAALGLVCIDSSHELCQAKGVRDVALVFVEVLLVGKVEDTPGDLERLLEPAVLKQVVDGGAASLANQRAKVGVRVVIPRPVEGDQQRHEEDVRVAVVQVRRFRLEERRVRLLEEGEQYALEDIGHALLVMLEPERP